ncbi:MAG TPA: penicillin-binding protein 1C [Rhizomicrobium sp.]|jgi:penicillin-binding protein 1C
MRKEQHRSVVAATEILRRTIRYVVQFAKTHRRVSIVAGAFVVLLAMVAIADAVFPPDMARYENISPEVVARDGSLLKPYLSKDGFWRLKTTVRDVNPRYLALLKAYEDKRFDSHHGIDLLAVGRAALQYASAGHVVSGASTLSMQAARLLEPPHHRSLGAKLVQMIRAVQLEQRYSKDEVLSIYITLAPFGGNLEGVRAASLSYFGKEPDALDLSEAALLVALPQSPAKLRPDRHGIAAIKGRNKVLARMVDEGVISASDAAVARREGAPSMRLAMPARAPHLSDKLRRTHTGRIATTIDPALQAAIERMAEQESAYFESGASLATVVVENKSRNVLAYIGGTNYHGASGQIDLASRPRSPGSALKPFIYGLAFDDLILHPSTMMEDQATIFGDYAPKDFSGEFQGAVTARDALRMSLNVPAVMVLDRVGPLRFTLTLQNAGAHLAFPTRDDTPSLPVALGGLGIDLADITMLYAGIADGGVAKPLRYLATDKPGASHRLFGPVAAYYLRDILKGIALPEGWAMGQGLARRTIAFKTGTSYGFRDAWSVGFSNDYTVGVWTGRADGAPRAGSIGLEAAAPILLKTFGLLPRDKSPDPTPPAGTIVAQSTDALPEALRTFARETLAPQPVQTTNVPPPSISFPPNGATIPVEQASAKDAAIQLRADGGREPLTWLVNGQLIGNFNRFTPALYTPSGEGFAKVTVVDAQGRSDTAQVRFKKLR